MQDDMQRLIRKDYHGVNNLKKICHFMRMTYLFYIFFIDKLLFLLDAKKNEVISLCLPKQS